jgi:hypothetical protein
MQELNVRRWLDSAAYEQQKAVIAKEVNSLKCLDGKAAISIGNPGRLHYIDYSVFKKDINEKMKLYTLKKQAQKNKKLTLIGKYEF